MIGHWSAFVVPQLKAIKSNREYACPIKEMFLGRVDAVI